MPNYSLKICLLPLLFIFFFNQGYGQGSVSALKLNGINDYVLFNQNNRGITNQVTISSWVKTTSSKYHWVIGKYDWGGDKGYHLYIRDGRAAFAGRDGTSNYRNSGVSTIRINDNKWHHLTGVFDRGTWQIYVDGILQSEVITGSINYVTSSAPLAIGKDYLSNNEQFDGIVDEIRIWKKALTETEIRESMCMKISSSSPDLVGHFTFDEGSGSSVKDQSSLNLGGSFVNMTPSTAWVVSGAPIGDKSTYIYTTNWQGQHLSIKGASEANFSVDSAGATTKGIHLYHVSNKPNFTNGLPTPDQTKEYFGVFTPLTPDISHKISYELSVNDCKNTMYEREDNSVQHWKELNVKYDATSFKSVTTTSRGEFVIDETLSQTFDIEGTLSYCKGGSTILTVNTTVPVEWSDGSKSRALTVHRPGIYEATVKFGNCVITKKVEVVENPATIFSLGQDLSICAGEKILLQGPPQMVGYSWSTGAGSQVIEVTQPGIYWLEVINQYGCKSRESINVGAKQEPILNIPTEYFACIGEKVVIDATLDGASYLWSNGQNTSAIEITAPSSITLELTVDGCTYFKAFKVTDEECISIPNVITPNGDNKNDFFVIIGASPAAIEVEIFNRWGVSVYKKTGYDGNWSAQNLTAGTYFYVVKSSRSKKTYKGWVEVLL